MRLRQNRLAMDMFRLIVADHMHEYHLSHQPLGVVAVLYGPSPGIDSEVAAHLRSQLARTAAEQGVVAVVQISTRASLRVFPWAQTRRRNTQPVATWLGPNGRPFDSRAGVHALMSMEHAAAVSLFEGSGTTLASVLDEAECLRLSPDPVLIETTFVRSDHYQFVQVGIFSVMLAPGRAGGGEAAWKAFQTKSYHKPSDDLAHRRLLPRQSSSRCVPRQLPCNQADPGAGAHCRRSWDR